MQPIAEPEVGDAVLSGVRRRQDLALDAARPEPARHDDALDAAQGAIEFLWCHRLGVHPDDFDVDVVVQPGVSQGFRDAHVGVVQIDVLADQGDLHGVPLGLDPVDHVGPLAQISVERQVEVLGNVGAEAGRLLDQRHLVDRRRGRHRDHGLRVDVAEEGDLLLEVLRDLLVGPADDHVGLDADGPEFTDALLGRLGLELAAADLGEEGDVDVEHVPAADLAPHLPDAFEERLALDVADGAADLDDDDVTVVLPGGEHDPVLDLVGDVRDDLDGAAEVVAAALLRDHCRVDLAGRDVAGLGQVLVDEALVVTEVEVGLPAIVGDEDLAMLVRRHRAGVDVEVRVELHHRDADAPGLEQAADRRGGNALTDRRDDATCYEDVFRHPVSVSCPAWRRPPRRAIVSGPAGQRLPVHLLVLVRA